LPTANIRGCLALLVLGGFSFGSVFTNELDAGPECGTFITPMTLECSRVVWPAFSVCDVTTVAEFPVDLKTRRSLSEKSTWKIKCQ